MVSRGRRHIGDDEVGKPNAAFGESLPPRLFSLPSNECLYRGSFEPITLGLRAILLIPFS